MDSHSYHNPYSGLSFFGFLWQMALRFGSFISGNLPADQLASDETQMLVLVGVAASSALVGTFLVLRKMTMLANSLSHTILIGIVIAFLWSSGGHSSHGHKDGYEAIEIPSLLAAALLMGLVTAFLTEALTKFARLQEDASTGLVFTSFFAIGVIALTVLMRNVHIGTEAVMGNVDALQLHDAKLVYAVLVLNGVLFFLFFKEYKITTFDAGLSKALGIAPLYFNYLLMAQVSTTAIGAFRAVGVLMVLAFITGPPLAARLLTHDLKRMIFISVILGCLAALIGVAIARHLLSVHGLPLSTAGLVVCAILLIYLLIAMYVSIKKSITHSERG